MMKKALCILFAASLLLSAFALAGCGRTAASEGSSAASSEAEQTYVGEIVRTGDFPSADAPVVLTVECRNSTAKIELSEMPDGHCLLTVNGSAVSLESDYELWYITSAQALDDTILVCGGSGGDVNSTVFYALDTAGNILMYVHSFDHGMYMTDFDVDKYGCVQYRFEGGKLIFQATRVYHGPSICTDSEAVEMRDDDGKLIEGLFSDDEVIERQYEIEYLGDGKFGSPVPGEVTLTYGEFFAQTAENDAKSAAAD